MAKSSMNLQDGILNQLRKENSEVKLLLLDGTEIVGCVRGFDSFTVIMGSGETQHLVYKHAIAQIVAKRFPVRREEPRGDARRESGGGPRRPEPGNSAPEARKREKKEGFNTLNLSNVVVPGKTEG